MMAASAMVTAMPLTKNAVRTTLMSGNFSKLRKFGCQAGTCGAVGASLFFFKNGSMDSVVLSHQGQQAEPAHILRVFREGFGKGHVVRLRPRHEIELESGDAETRRDRRVEPRELGRKLHAQHLADRLAGLHFVESDRGLELFEQPLDQQRSHSG